MERLNILFLLSYKCATKLYTIFLILSSDPFCPVQYHTGHFYTPILFRLAKSANPSSAKPMFVKPYVRTVCSVECTNNIKSIDFVLIFYFFNYVFCYQFHFIYPLGFIMGYSGKTSNLCLLFETLCNTEIVFSRPIPKSRSSLSSNPEDI